MRYSIALNSDIGTRSANQDRLAYSERENSMLMVVADGLGGYAGGEVAAQALVDTTIEFYERTPGKHISDPATFLVLATSYAHNMINKRAKDDGIGVSLPRTTCVLCLIQNGYAYWSHVGDSRLYHLRGKELVTRTVDHTTVDQMLHEGMINENETQLAQAQLLRCVGGTRRPTIDLGAETRLEQGDYLLLCTDGVWRALKDHAVAAFIHNIQVEEGLEKLFRRVEKTFRRDRDNMSAILLHWEEPATSASSIFELATPELDQAQLWRKVSRAQRSPTPARAPTAQADKSPTRTRDADVETTIEEIESFIDGIEDWL